MHRRRQVSRHARRVTSAPVVSGADTASREAGSEASRDATETASEEDVPFQAEDRFADIESALGDFETRFRAIEENLTNAAASISSLHHPAAVQHLTTDTKADIDAIEGMKLSEEVVALRTRLDFMASKDAVCTALASSTIINHLKELDQRVTAMSEAQQALGSETNADDTQCARDLLETFFTRQDGEVVTKDVGTLKRALAQLHQSCEKRASTTELDALKRQVANVQTSLTEMCSSKKAENAAAAEAQNGRDARLADLESKMANIVQGIDTQCEEQRQYAITMTNDIKNGLNALQDKLHSSVIDDLKDIIADMQIDKINADLLALKEEVQAATTTKKKAGPKKKGSEIEVEKS